LDTEVRLKVKNIFEHLRKQQPKLLPRNSDHIDVEDALREYQHQDMSKLELDN